MHDPRPIARPIPKAETTSPKPILMPIPDPIPGPIGHVS